MKQKTLKYLSAFVIFLSFVTYITYPLLFNLGSKVTWFGDELVIAWIQNWVIHAISTDPLSLFNANTYHPYNNVLAYSDLFLTSSISAIIPLQLIAEPIAVFNFTLISSLILLGFAIFCLSYYLTKDFWISMLTGILVIFSPAVLDKKVHIQILSIQWIPFAMLTFLMFLKKRKTPYLMASMTLFLLQTYNSFMPGYFLVFFYGISFSYYYFLKKESIKRFITIPNISVVLTTLILLLPIIVPYYQVSSQFNYVRDIRDTIHFALQPEDLLYPNEHTRLQGALLSISNRQNYPADSSMKTGYLGAVFTVLVLITFFLWLKNWSRKNIILNIFVITGLMGLFLSLGPALHFNRVTIHKPFLVPLPYAFFYYIAPGFKGFRNSARWEMLFIIGMTIAIGLVLNKLLRSIGYKKRLMVIGFLILGVVAEYNFPMKFQQVPQKNDFPQVYHWLAAAVPEDTAVIIMPAYNWNMKHSEDEIMRQYYSTIHFRRTVNGYSGFSPPAWQDFLIELAENFPSQSSLDKLKNIGVRYIIVDKDGYDKSFSEGYLQVDGSTIIDLLSKNGQINFVGVKDNYFIFQFEKSTNPGIDVNQKIPLD